MNSGVLVIKPGKCILTLNMQNTGVSCVKNRADPDQLASKKSADLDLHCFPFCLQLHVTNNSI